ncbi:hypothetical protein S14_2 [Shewanella sp. phage 1/4]|uniref:hypothetical protein n=1 Tax=Shewanella phage 1/4 TaxID=1458859 RepID=UPI0004F6FD3C|nr:hypothetical protein S14_2 [Shewanella sp. phage 1/4]AHK11114.1 hypothetical protein S14_2 [Shewanella sp. phage 1/4]
MSKTVFFKCHTDGYMPDDVILNDIIKVETHTCIGWIDVTEDFQETSNNVKYRFTIE